MHYYLTDAHHPSSQILPFSAEDKKQTWVDETWAAFYWERKGKYPIRVPKLHKWVKGMRQNLSGLQTKHSNLFVRLHKRHATQGIAKDGANRNAKEIILGSHFEHRNRPMDLRIEVNLTRRSDIPPNYLVTNRQWLQLCCAHLNHHSTPYIINHSASINNRVRFSNLDDCCK